MLKDMTYEKNFPSSNSQQEVSAAVPANQYDTLPHHGGVELTEQTKELLRRSCQEVRDLQAQQLAELQRFIDSKALELAEQQFPQNMADLRNTMRNRRATDKARETARVKLQELVAVMSQIMLGELSMGGFVRESPLSHAREVVDEIIEEAGIDRRNPTAVLQAVGMLQANEAGAVDYVYPHALLPDETVTKLEEYIAAVIAHVEAGQAEDPHQLIQRDIVRRNSHNAVARDLAKILQLQHPDGTSYETADYRPLVSGLSQTYKDGAPYQEVQKLSRR